MPNDETPLEARLKRMIATSGPIDLATYMTLCLSDPEHGYYTRKKPIGVAGDFTTAPEVSQLFGELIGIWFLSVWHQSGCPTPFHLVELGPGRGTLMRDMIRTIKSAPDAAKDLKVHLVEISPSLKQQQHQTLSDLDISIEWHTSIDSLPDAPIFLAANEFFDCLPIHQWVRKGDKWHERVVGLNANNQLAFGLGTVRALTPDMPELAIADGIILEQSPASTAVMANLASKIGQQGGAGLFIDYGYCEPGYGDTFQALHQHSYADPLNQPGEQDLTAHVNFHALERTARQAIRETNASLTVPPTMTQGTFLLEMGLLERAGQLGTGKTHHEQDSIRDAVERLAAPDQMGDLFKCLAIKPEESPLPPNT